MSDDADSCGSGGGSTDLTGLRIASIFIIWLGGTAGTLFPILAKRTSLAVPKSVFEFAKYFGSGVIIATAFIHLLAPALDELGSDCLDPKWQDYPYALALALLSIFLLFVAELFAFRIGTAKLKRLGIPSYDAHGHGLGSHAAHGPESSSHNHAGNDLEGQQQDSMTKKLDTESTSSQESAEAMHSALAQIIGISILEFGVVLHSVLIGLTLAVDPDFKVLFVVLIFHQTFEGLGLGSRLAFLRIPGKHQKSIPIIAALVYGLCTPIGIAAGLGVRTSYNPGSTTASIVSGVLDAVSAGILIYTGLVELLAHEFLFSPEMREASNGKVAYAVGCMALGMGLMALLGRWA
ncbi:ZIP-like iron-zinc transporter [Peniophora sp. CONT]|nr:ZIP-like iron-zinc transporter [Peniophora sp. CONT]